MNTKIPTNNYPQISECKIIEQNEPLISLSELGFFCNSEYYKQNIPGATKDCFSRKTVAEKLLQAQSLLPQGYKFKIYDAYRPIEVQESLWNKYQAQILEKYPQLSEEELDKMTSIFVSKPSYDEYNPSLHNTGGAIDLTIVDTSGNELDMGTKFDDFSNMAWTDYFEQKNINKKVRNNRRLLYNVMISVGFTNLPSEWWHYEYGNKNWAYYNNTDAIYKGILEFKK